MIPYRFISAAEQELDGAIAYYEKERAGLGMDLLSDVAETIERARRLPHSGTRVTGLSETADVRRYILRRFPYKLIGVVREEILTIIAVAHQRQHPAQWLRRLAKTRR